MINNDFRKQLLCLLRAYEMHVLKMVYFPIATLLNIYFMNNQSMQVSYDLFYYEVSSKIVFKLNCFFKEPAEIK